mmetsp:Transcript_18494/g.13295  ORF Transcript_18494/g.13295 Transcript_18494/m.13295 type:complete len:117 (+) Transcript_18494:484-834(+)
MHNFKKDCEICMGVKPPSAHHCRVCNRCVNKMDHHCPWINNCIGVSNLKYFILFNVYCFVGCIFTIMRISITIGICASLSECHTYSDSNFGYSVVRIGACVLCVCMAIFTYGMTKT